MGACEPRGEGRMFERRGRRFHNPLKKRDATTGDVVVEGERLVNLLLEGGWEKQHGPVPA